MTTGRHFRDEQPEEVSRRDFLHKGGGFLAGLAGVLGIGSVAGLFDKPQRTSGYGSAPYGGKKEA